MYMNKNINSTYLPILLFFTHIFITCKLFIFNKEYKLLELLLIDLIILNILSSKKKKSREKIKTL